MEIGQSALESMGIDPIRNTQHFTVRKTCRICYSEDLEFVLDYGPMPLAGGFAEHDDPRSLEVFPLSLVRCRHCSLLQVPQNIEPEKIFSTYSYASSYNRTLVKHFEQVADELKLIAGEEGLIVEFGCNDGVLLNPLQKRSANIVGVDPSDVAVRASSENGWKLYPSYFSTELAYEIRAAHGLAKIVTAHNVCAHVDDPNDFMHAVDTLLEEKGLFIFEVHYQGDLMAMSQYDTVYHEHTCYYSVTALSHLLYRHGFEILDVRRIPIHSGSIHVTAGRVGMHTREANNSADFIADESKWDLSGFSNRVQSLRAALFKLLSDLAKAGKKIVAYGASGRATILLNYCGLGPDIIDHVSDLSPLRYGKVVPGVRIPIMARSKFNESPPDYALITAWNYEKEILADEATYLADGGIMIIPLPSIRLAIAD